MLELVDKFDLKSNAHKACGFDSRPAHQKKELQQGGFLFLDSDIDGFAQGMRWLFTLATTAGENATLNLSIILGG